MKYDINKVICIQLKSHNEQQLKNISEFYKLDFDALVRIKENADKIWVEMNGDFVIAFICKDDRDKEFIVNDLHYRLSEKEIKKFLQIRPIKTPKLRKSRLNVQVVNETSTIDTNTQKNNKIHTKVEIVLDVDTILDKIIDFGIDKLTKEELAFLDSQKYSS